MSTISNTIKLIYLGEEGSPWFSLLSKIADTSGCFAIVANPKVLSKATSSRFAPLLLVNQTNYQNFQELKSSQDNNGPVVFLSNGNHEKKDSELWLHLNYTPTEIENFLLKQWSKFQLTLENQNDNALNMAQDIIAMAAHDMRTPLTSILGFCDIALDEDLAAKSNSFQAYFQRIENNAKIMDDTITRYMTSFRANKGKIEVQPTHTNIKRSLCDDLEFNASRIEKKGINFVFECAPTVPEGLYIDRHLIMQIVRNLVDNAIKYTDKGFIKVAIDYNKDLDLLMIDVSDTGQGIALDRHQEVFHAYNQAWHSESRYRTRGGVGLGLNTAKKIARLMGGDVSLIASKPELGSTFRVNIKAGGVPKTYTESGRGFSATKA